MRRAFVLGAGFAIAVLTGCGSRNLAGPPVSGGAPLGPVAMTLTVTRGTTTASAAREARTIPANALSVDARVWSGAVPTGTPINTSCAAFAGNSATLTLSVPIATETIQITSYDGPCASGLGTGNVLTQFVGTGTVTATSTNIATVFNGGVPIVLGKALPAYPDLTPTAQWTELGPKLSANAGKLQSWVRDATNPQRMWVAAGQGRGYEVGSAAGIFRTTNGGTTWTRSNVGLNDTNVNDLWLSPQGTVLVAATTFGGISRSLDGGASWTSVLSSSVTCIVQNRDGSLLACGAEGVYASTDSGATWTLAYPTPKPINTIAVGANALYAGGVDNAIYENAGGGWSTRSAIVAPTSAGTTFEGIHALVYDAVHQTLFATVNGTSAVGTATQLLYLSTDDARTWAARPLTTDTRGAQTIAASPSKPGTIYIAGTGSAGLLTTSDGGMTFATAYNAGDSRGLYVTQGSAGADLLVEASDQGLFSYPAASGALSPTPLIGKVDNFVSYAVAVTPTGTVFAALQDYAPEISRDGGTTWVNTNDATFVEDGEPYIDPADATHWLLYDQGGLHVSRDGGATFAHVAGVANGPFFPDNSIAIDPTVPKTVYLGTLAGVLKSTDGGTTFGPSGWPFAGRAFPILISADGRTYLIDDGTALWLSRDRGVTWKASVLNGLSLAYGAAFAISPLDADIVVAAANYASSVYVSVDGGVSFRPIASSGLPLPTASAARARTGFGRRLGDLTRLPWAPAQTGPAQLPLINRLVFDPAASYPLLAATTTTGIFVSTDYGRHWHNVTGNASVNATYGAAFANGKLYVSTLGAGVLVSTALR